MRAALGLGLAVLGAMALVEITMAPTSSERTTFLLLFGAMAIVTGLLGWLLPRLTRRSGSLRSAVIVIAVAAIVAVAVATAVAARLMFIQPHDLDLVTVVLGFGVVLGLILATTLSASIADDLGRIGRTADRVSQGDMEARTGVERPDELGRAAAAIDEMARQLQAAAKERERAEAARRHFLAAVGHDLRSPLAALRAAVETLEDGLAPDPGRFLVSMRADLDAISHLVDDLFLLAAIEAGRLDVGRETFDLTELVDEAIEALQPVAARKQVSIRLFGDRVLVDGGVAELGRVIRNLLHNAIRHTPEGSVVCIEVGCDPAPELVVRDEGPGFDPDLAARAFDQFVTGDSARTRGTGRSGLGLAIAKGIVQAHGGEVWVGSGPGGEVGFRLPARL